MTNSNNDLHALFVKHSIRPFKIKLNRLSKEEYRTAVENTLLRRYNIQECYVETVRLDDYDSRPFDGDEQNKKVRKLVHNQKPVRSHVLWLPITPARKSQ